MEAQNQYLCRDGFSAVVIAAVSHYAAAEEFIAQGGWSAGDQDSTIWVPVWVQEQEEEEAEHKYLVSVDPLEPDCLDDLDHEWTEEEGVVYSEICNKCGLIRKVDNDALDPETGQRGLRSLQYLTEPPR